MSNYFSFDVSSTPEIQEVAIYLLSGYLKEQFRNELLQCRVTPIEGGRSLRVIYETFEVPLEREMQVKAALIELMNGIFIQPKKRSAWEHLLEDALEDA
jgi:hypothetical protein